MKEIPIDSHICIMHADIHVDVVNMKILLTVLSKTNPIGPDRNLTLKVNDSNRIRLFNRSAITSLGILSEDSIVCMIFNHQGRQDRSDN